MLGLNGPNLRRKRNGPRPVNRRAIGISGNGGDGAVGGGSRPWTPRHNASGFSGFLVPTVAAIALRVAIPSGNGRLPQLVGLGGGCIRQLRRRAKPTARKTAQTRGGSATA
ncbi:hypothetical protein CRG98_005852 [Punica granatum]|uniref:Uncharacterized protein n=1 Tax=Punica granatum TaxID=22663 RepID=A0A2I0KZ51_PUNGR|nr:hypothetical protein CRG98_005852 [Punica granatum]